MHDDPDAPATDDLRRWLGDDPPTVTAPDDAAVHRRRRWLLIASCMVAPWVVLLVVSVGRPAGGPAPAAPAHTSPSDAAAAAPSPSTAGAAAPSPSAAGAAAPSPSTAAAAAPSPSTAGASESAPGRDEVVPSERRDAPVPAAVAPVAVGLVRDAATRIGARTSALDSAAAERPQRLAPRTWIVRVHTVVLHGDRRRWHTARHEIWVVPVGRRRSRTVGLDRPWRVSTAAPRTARTAWRPTEVDVTAVRAALGAADLHVDRVRAQRHPDLPHIVRVRAARGWVWVRLRPRVALVGTPPDTPTPEVP